MKIKNLFKFGCVAVVVGILSFSGLQIPEAKAQLGQPVQNLVTNFTTATTNNLLATNVIISQIQILAGSQPVIVNAFDTAYPSIVWTNSAYISVGQYMTSIVTTVVSPLTGYTNLFTNYGTFTYTNTVAASTNNLLPYQSFAAQANTLATFPVALVNPKGLTLTSTTNCSVIVRYYINGN